MEHLKRLTVKRLYIVGGLDIISIPSKAKAVSTKQIDHIFARPQAQWVPLAIHWLAISLRREPQTTSRTVGRKALAPTEFNSNPLEGYSGYKLQKQPRGYHAQRPTNKKSP